MFILGLILNNSNCGKQKDTYSSDTKLEKLCLKLPYGNSSEVKGRPVSLENIPWQANNTFLFEIFQVN